AVGDVHLVAMAMPLGNLGRAVDVRDAARRVELGRIGAETHRAAEVAARRAPLQHVAAQPFGHQADDRLVRLAELRGTGLPNSREAPGRLDDRHLHSEADAEIGYVP